MTKLLPLLAVVVLLAGCTSPLPVNVSRVAPQPQQTKVTGEDAWVYDLMKADVWDPRQPYALQTPSRLIDSFLKADLLLVSVSIDETEGADEALAPRLLHTKKSALTIELSQTYPTAPTTQSALVNAIDQPVKLVLK